MKYPDYERAFSSARLNKYLKACDGDAVAALTLYRHNIKLVRSVMEYSISSRLSYVTLLTSITRQYSMIWTGFGAS